MFGFLHKRRIAYRTVTDAGLARADNQDRVAVNAGGTVCCVADGMGGERDGARAAAAVCDEVSAADGATFLARIEDVDLAVLRANDRIRDATRGDGLGPSGAAFAVVVLDADPAGGRLAIGHLGDCRVYRRRGVTLERMTEDHRKSTYSHVLTRAVGVSDRIEVDWSWAGVQKGDLWLVCSDGVHDMLTDATINGILAHTADLDAQTAALADAVRRAGARDNFTFILLRT